MIRTNQFPNVVNPLVLRSLASLGNGRFDYLSL